MFELSVDHDEIFIKSEIVLVSFQKLIQPQSIQKKKKRQK